MGFHLKSSVDYYETFPDELKLDLVEKLVTHGFSPYSSADWAEVVKVRAELNSL